MLQTTSLSSIDIPSSVTSIGSWAFGGCSNLKSVDIPYGVKAIPDYCFYRCYSLTSVQIPESITSVGSYSFSESHIWVIDLPESVKSIGDGCFTLGDIVNVIIRSNSAVTIQYTATVSGVHAIFVPENLIEMYKYMTGWSENKEKLHPISSYHDKDQYNIVTSGFVDMGCSIKWAACNLGASQPEEYGGHYQWAGTQDVSNSSKNLNWSNCPYHTGSKESTNWTKYIPSDKSSYWSGSGSPDNKIVLDPEDDVAHVVLGGKWRMPTNEEFEELIHKCYSEWTTYKGVNGRMLYGSESTNKIFLPASNLHSAGTYGCYWSSSLYVSSPSCAREFRVDSNIIGGGNEISRYNGHSVRPVSE